MVNPDDLISIIIPCRNEEGYLASCLDSVLNFDLPYGAIEVLVIDGMSIDATPRILNDYSQRFPNIKIFRNPDQIIPVAVNIGIKNAQGGVIVRLDAHSSYPKEYLARCVKLLTTSGAGNAGGRFVNIRNGNGIWAEPVRFVTGHVFGVGNGAFRTGTVAGFVDTVPYGTFRREIFTTVGMFDERLTRSEDNEFNDRLRRAGYKIAFDPAIEIYYKNQPTLKGLMKQAFYTGMWNVYAARLYLYTFKWRRFVPGAFVFYLLSIPFAIIYLPHYKYYLLPALFYLSITLAISFIRNSGFMLQIRTAITFFSYHVSYGVGTLSGLLNVLAGNWKKHLGKPLP